MRSPLLLVAIASVTLALGAGVLTVTPASAAINANAIWVTPYASGTYTPGNACSTASSAHTRTAANGGGQPVGTIQGAGPEQVTFTNECSTALYVFTTADFTATPTLAGTMATQNSQFTVTVDPNVVAIFIRTASVYGSGVNATGMVIVNVTGGGGSGGGSSSATAAAPAPVAAILALDLSIGGASCKESAAVPGHVGQWVTLPGQGDCSLPSKPGAVLLGWATTADFPVAIAQRQADMGWGAYQLTNDAGEVTAVFIPAGHEAFVSGSNALNPIWSA